MDRLWAPWRMNYIVKNPDEKHACFLCESLARAEDRKDCVLYRGRLVAVIMNIYPYNSGHLLVLPNRHAQDFNGLTREEQVDLMRITQESMNILREEMGPEGFNVGINIGKSAGAGLPGHLHVQIVPRWTGDTSSITVLDNTRVMPESLDDTYEKLRPYFDKLKSQPEKDTDYDG